MKRSAAVALGTIWGVFSLFYSFVVLFVLFSPETAYSVLGNFISLAACLFNGINLSTYGFQYTTYLIGIGGFVLVILGLIAAGMRKHYIASGILLLISTAGVFLLYYLPLTFGFNGLGGVLSNLDLALNYGGSVEVVAVIIIAFAAMLVTLFGFIGALVSFAPKRTVQGYYGQPYGQPYQAPYQPPYGAPPYGQPQQPYNPQYQHYGQAPQYPPQYQQPQAPPQYQPFQQPPQAPPPQPQQPSDTEPPKNNQ